MGETFVRLGLATAGVLVAVCAASVGLSAGITPNVPEIDGSAVPAAIGALTAGVLIIRARRGAK